MNRRVAGALVIVMATCIVALAVLMVFHWLFAALGDDAAARVLFGFAIACLVMLTIDVLLLVGISGWIVATDSERRERDATVESDEPPESLS